VVTVGERRADGLQRPRAEGAVVIRTPVHTELTVSTQPEGWR